MQLVQIGETREKTVLDMVLEMAGRQVAEINQLKALAYERAATRRTRRARPRCSAPNSDH